MAPQSPQVTTAEKVVAYCSFLPFFGFLLAFIALFQGVLKVREGGVRLMLLGAGGFLANLLFCFFLFHMVFTKFEGKPQIKEEMARRNLRETVMALEFYKQVHGNYPAELKALAPEGHPYGADNIFLYDVSYAFSPGNFQMHQYAPSPNGLNYQLYDLGPDMKPGTADDVAPDLTAEEAAHSGYLASMTATPSP